MKDKVDQKIFFYRGSAGKAVHHPCRAKPALFRACLSWVVVLFIFFATSDCRLEAKTPAEVFREASKSVVVIKTYDDKGMLLVSGSGIVLDKVGYVVTNYHVIERAVKIVVIYDNTQYPATAKYVDRIRDICSLTVPGLNALPASPGKSSEIVIGSSVYAIGYPMAVGLTFSHGLVSCLRETSGGCYIQFTAPISPGSSGGGLFDEQAHLIGIPTYFVTQGQLLNFALPVEWAYDLPKRHVAQSAAVLSEKSDDEFQHQTIALEEKEDWVAQIQLCERWTKEFPGSVRAWDLLGAAYANNGEFRKAIKAYTQALHLNPDSSQNWLELGLLYGKIGRRDKQIESYRKAVLNNPEYPGGWFRLAVAYRDADQFSDALEASQQVTRINPVHVSAWMIQGYSYGKLGDQAREIEAYLQAINIDQYSAEAYVSLGVAYCNAHREEDEVASYQQALHVNPDESSALFNLGHYYMAHGNKEKGMDYYSRLKSVDPELARIFYDDLKYRVFPAMLQRF
jgi:tetratricopeptide (TPR) repeat protein